MKNIFFAILVLFMLADVACAETDGQITVENIPASAKCYFDAVAKKELNVLSDCFQADAVIIDVNREIAGIRAIRNWAEDEVFGGRHEILEIVSQKKGLRRLKTDYIDLFWVHAGEFRTPVEEVMRGLE